MGALRADSRRRRQSPQGTRIRQSCRYGDGTHSVCDLGYERLAPRRGCGRHLSIMGHGGCCGATKRKGRPAAEGRPHQIVNSRGSSPAARSPASGRPSDIPPLWRDDRGPLPIYSPLPGVWPNHHRKPRHGRGRRGKTRPKADQVDRSGKGARRRRIIVFLRE